MLEDSITGLTPEAVVTFQEPTHPTHFRPQRLEVELSVASLSDNGVCVTFQYLVMVVNIKTFICVGGVAGVCLFSYLWK